MHTQFDREATIQTIKQLLAENSIILFMKGTPEQPQCGFSSTAVQILKACGKPFASVNILQHPDIRATLKEVTDWPTFPQLIVNGKLIGGSDIMQELYEEGELETILDSAKVDDEGYESESDKERSS